MDIEYLLFLQRFRESINDSLTPFMEGISLFAVTYLIMIPVFVYWVVSKRKGLYTLVSYYLCCGFNAIVKLTVCAYRPWIRDARVHPAGDAITTATGYSFPSGHTVTAGPIYGGLAVVSWSWKKFVSVILGIFLLLTAFSRNYLGVHTPQDVFVGICESVFWLIIVAKIFTYLDEHPEKENLLLLICFIVGWLGIAYITFKPYPMDYVDGKLLVDPQKMMNDGYGDICLLIAFPVARYIEKRWIGFQAPGLKGAGLAAGIAGLIPLFLMIKFMRPALDGVLGTHWGHFANTFIIVLYCIALWPLVIKAVSKTEAKAEDKAEK
ncbi:MAG: phosphatase PAP2 family protein [Oscillospiraceae bacterium]|jgi:membrane-associated phospholipid phosphatase|nr:phosphatase PAP2 family protein [Oscillospiraceae bacterium]